jgi:hypothetical protein
MENFNVENLFDLRGLMNLFNATDLKGVVAMEKKLVNFLTEEQLIQVAQIEKNMLNDLMVAKNNYQALKEKYNKLVEKLASIGIDANAILNQAQANDEEQEDYEDEYEEDEEDEEDEDYED